ncbi:MAG: AcvB/VirJ family lysyl-phosphatidylglycerol hydrolase, partial [Bacteroidales bacterium]
MSLRIFSIVILAVIVSARSGADTVTDSVVVNTFGNVHIYKPSGTPSEVIIMISGDGGWRFGVIGFSKKFADLGALVAGVDILRYNRELRRRTGDCYSIAADFVELATAIEKKYNLPEYQPAVLMGYSSGATLVYGILAQARPGTFKGGISLGFCPDMDLPKMLCQINGL